MSANVDEKKEEQEQVGNNDEDQEPLPLDHADEPVPMLYLVPAEESPVIEVERRVALQSSLIDTMWTGVHVNHHI